MPGNFAEMQPVLINSSGNNLEIVNYQDINFSGNIQLFTKPIIKD